MSIEKKEIKSFVLRKGRMSDGQREAYKTLSEHYLIDYSDKLIDVSSLFKNKNSIVLEIGFGMGDATWQIAMKNPNINYIGIEVHTPGVGKLLHRIDENKLENIRIIEHDAVEVLQNMIPDQSIDAIHLFFPDPWPKKKHHKRRIIQHDFLNLVAKKLKKESYFLFVTDWQDYADWALEIFRDNKYYELEQKGFLPASDWRPKTKFELKGLDKSHKINEILAIKSF